MYCYIKKNKDKFQKRLLDHLQLKVYKLGGLKIAILMEEICDLILVLHKEDESLNYLFENINLTTQLAKDFFKKVYFVTRMTNSSDKKGRKIIIDKIANAL